MALISCPECGKEVSDRAPACIHCGYPLSSAAPYADFRPITGPNRFTVRLTARPAYPDARSRTLRALMKELGLSREQGIRLLEQARREPVPLREGLTEEEALALLEALIDWQKEDKLFENQQLLRTPIVRNGRQATVGYCPEIWAAWE